MSDEWVTSYSPNRGDTGQSMTETLVMLPLFMTVAFFVLQLGQLASAVVIVNYGASKVAKQVVSDDPATVTGNLNNYRSIFEQVLMVGLSYQGLAGKLASPDPTSRDVTVNACASTPAFPLVGQFLKRAWDTRYQPNLGADGCPDDSTRSLGPIYFMTQPPRFIVHGKATVRMNYQGK